MNLALQTTSGTVAKHAIERETIVVCGEFEVGKSSVVNAIMRRPFLPNDPGFFSRPLVRIRHASKTVLVAELVNGASYELDSFEDVVERDDVANIVIHTPMPGLEAVEIIEVPFNPTNGIDPKHSAIMREANLLVWVTIASQTWRLSEKSIIQTLPKDIAKRSVLAISRADKLRSAEDLDKIETRLQREAADFFTEIVFMQASTQRLNDCQTSDKLWAETGGQALVEIAQDLLGDLSFADDDLLSAFDDPKFGRRGGDQIGEGLPADAIVSPAPMMPKRESEMDATLNEIAAQEEAKTQAPLIESTFFKNRTVPKSFGRRGNVDDAAAPIVDRVAMPAPDSAPEAPIEEVTTRYVEPEPEPAPITPEPVPETPAETLKRSIAEMTGLKTAGVMNASTKELITCFAEDTIKAEECIEIFSAVIDTDIRMMRLLGDETLQETTLTLGHHLIMLHLIEGNTDQIAFFILNRESSNPAVSNMLAKRLVSNWRETLNC